MENLPEEILQRRTMPLKPDAINLYGKIVYLQPLDLNRDSEVLFHRLNGSSIQLASKSYPAYNADLLVWKCLGFDPSSTHATFLRI
jgi:hypothetical protein